MLKLFLLLACINLLVIANTNVFKNTISNEKSSIGTKVDAKLAANQTETYVPLMFVETKVGQIRNVGNVNEYPCPNEYSYLSYNDYANNLIDICQILPGNGVAYRLQGGGSATSAVLVNELSTDLNTTFRCDSLKADVDALNQALCAKTTIIDTKVSQNDGKCPSGYDTIINEEAKSNRNQLCQLLGSWDIVRIGLRGSFSGSGYGCEVRDFDDRGMGGTLCVKRQIQDIRIVDSSETSFCGEGSSPINAQEALNNRQKICLALGEWDIVRIAGGGTFDGRGYGCGLREHDRRGVGSILCAPENRA